MAQTGCVYLIQNTINDKEYVGITTYGAEQRFRRHIASAERRDEDCCIIHRAMRKYGYEKFYVSILEDHVPIEILGDREKYWIQKRGTLKPHGYNIREGGNDSGAIKILQIDPFSGEIISSYPSMTSASATTGIDLSAISKACRNAVANNGHIVKSAGGFIWRIEEKVDNEDGLYTFSNNPHIQRRKVYKILLCTRDILDEYDSVVDACTQNNICQSSLSSCLSGRYRSAGGFGWCFADEYKNYKEVHDRKRVKMLDISGNLIREFGSAEEASIAIYGSNDRAHLIRAACRKNIEYENEGTQRKSGGYIWRYTDEKTCERSSNRMATPN